MQVFMDQMISNSSINNFINDKEPPPPKRVIIHIDTDIDQHEGRSRKKNKRKLSEHTNSRSFSNYSNYCEDERAE